MAGIVAVAVVDSAHCDNSLPKPRLLPKAATKAETPALFLSLMLISMLMLMAWTPPRRPRGGGVGGGGDDL